MTDKKETPLKKLFILLSGEKQEVFLIYFYALFAGLLSLSLPLGIQAIIGIIQGGVVITSLYVLLGVVTMGLTLYGLLQIWQMGLVERIRQKVFAQYAFEFVFKLQNIKTESLYNVYPPELMNRFFEVISLQKGFPKLLIDLTSAFSQIIFGLLLLAFYHPVFLVIGLFLFVFLAVIFAVNYQPTLEASLQKSKYKYKVVSWLEEISRTLHTFKLSGDSPLPIQKADYFTQGYLNARKEYFSKLTVQYFSLLVFKILITAGLLVVGAILVINRQMSIGQLVASEVVIVLIMAAVEKLILSIDTFYEMVTSVEKIQQVMDFPLEDDETLQTPALTENELTIDLKNISYRFLNSESNIINNLTATINHGDRICLTGENGSGKTTFLKILSGLLQPTNGSILYNGYLIKDINGVALRGMMGDNFSIEEIFEGTLNENLTMGKEVDPVYLKRIMTDCGLNDWYQQLHFGLETPLLPGGNGLPGSIKRKIILARSIIGKPKLLILDDFNLNFPTDEKNKILKTIFSSDKSFTVLMVTNDPENIKLCKSTWNFNGNKVSITNNAGGGYD